MRAELGPAHLELAHDDLQRWRGPIVYVWTRGDAILYVSLSTKGLERPLSSTHGRLRHFAPGDRLTVWRSNTPAVLEANLIERLRPAFNRIPAPRRCERCGAPGRSARYCAFCASHVGAALPLMTQGDIGPRSESIDDTNP